MDQVEILGSLVDSMTSVDVVVKEKIRLLELLGEKLHLLQAQDALLLLRHSLAIPKVLHVLRSSPCFASTLLSDFDNLLRDILSDVINVWACVAAGLITCACWWDRDQKRCSAGTVCLSGLCCGLRRPGPPDPSPGYKTLPTLV